MPEGSDLLVAALEREGVDRIFGVPGEENLDTVEFLRAASIELVPHPPRAGAAFMAAMAVCGDGGFMMNSQELETAVRLKLDLVVLILNDSSYGMIRWKQAVDHFPDYGLTFGNPDFVRYAESYGAKGSRVTAVEDLVPTLEQALGSAGCISSMCRSTTPRTRAFSSRS